MPDQETIRSCLQLLETKGVEMWKRAEANRAARMELRRLIKAGMAAGRQEPKRQRPVTMGDIAVIAALREKGLPWVEVGQKMGRNAESCRRAYARACVK